jgi:hypothetical protein
MRLGLVGGPLFAASPVARLTGDSKDVGPAYAIVRVDEDASTAELRFTIRLTVWSETSQTLKFGDSPR